MCWNSGSNVIRLQFENKWSLLTVSSLNQSSISMYYHISSYNQFGAGNSDLIYQVVLIIFCKSSMYLNDILCIESKSVGEGNSDLSCQIAIILPSGKAFPSTYGKELNPPKNLSRFSQPVWWFSHSKIYWLWVRGMDLIVTQTVVSCDLFKREIYTWLI